MKQKLSLFDQPKCGNLFKQISQALALTGLFLILIGCGEESGQCGGARDSGLCVTIDSIAPIDNVTGFGMTSEVDAVRNLDCDLDPSTDDPEPWGDHSAEVSISVSKVPPATVPPAPAFVTLTQYTISYALDPGSPAGPALTSRTFNDTIKINTGVSLTTTLRFVEIAQKDQYVIGVGGAGNANPPRSYTATYTFTGADELNNPVTLTGRTQFSIGNFDLCSS